MVFHFKFPMRVFGALFLIWFTYRTIRNEPKQVVDYQNLFKFEQTRSIALKIYQLLSRVELGIFSPNGEDGIIYQLVNLFNVKPDELFVDIGAGNGKICNSR